jgi:hypothetical protein
MWPSDGQEGKLKCVTKKEVNPKWHKIKQLNAKTVVKTSSGLQMNKHSIKKKDLTPRFVVKNAELKLEQISTEVTEVMVAPSENLFQ